MSKEEILNNLNEIFKDVFDNDDIEINYETKSEDIQDWDSLMHISMMITIQQEFGITLNMAEIMKIKNVKDIVDIIVEKQ